MIRRPPRTNRTTTLCPYTTLFRSGRQHTRKWQNGQAEQTVLQQSAPVWIGCHDFFQALPGNGYMRLRAAAARVIGKMRHGEKAPSVVIMTLLNGESGFQPMAGASDRITSGTCLLSSEEHTSELQSLMRISYAVFCLNKKK